MLGLSYGELSSPGATAGLIGTPHTILSVYGPKDLPRIARVAGRLSGGPLGYVQLARGQFDNELQDTIAQLEAIRHEIRSISLVNPGPSSRRLVENVYNSTTSPSSDMHSQATAYARLAESSALLSEPTNNEVIIWLEFKEFGQNLVGAPGPPRAVLPSECQCCL
ncbi:hypothetical protein E3N88_36477 [Mikania micrantha]|uniref:Uncharacterized protein n=1 Tax=Mikania micrantha TaxID=192012 RepID=A0A5N6M400_9ASTR|nr:hypothetical protein E3N88_36477 [Mikania micrantha]